MIKVINKKNTLDPIMQHIIFLKIAHAEGVGG